MPASKHIKRARPKQKGYAKEYFIWCDESDQSGKFFSNFYGGVLVKSEDLHVVMDKLQKACRKLHLNDEIKWHKVSEHYVGKYKELMSIFFELVKAGKIKVRIMFTQKIYVVTRMQGAPKSDRFFILYYQFIKNAFGLAYSNRDEKEIFLRLYFDLLPGTLEKRRIFKECIRSLQATHLFQPAGIKIRKQDIAEVDSKKHLLLQMTDVVLGAICFKLNNKHREEKKRGKRIKAKEKVYRHISNKIREIRKGFKLAVSTGAGRKEDHWLNPYRHWRFKSSDFEAYKTLFS